MTDRGFMQSAGRRLRTSLRLLMVVVLAVWFVFASVVIALRYWILPEIGQYRGWIETSISRTVGLPVTIGKIEAGWAGLRPELILGEVQVANPAGQTVLAFNRIEAVLGWTTSLLFLEPRLHRLAIEAPVLHIERDTAGNFYVAGLPIDLAGDPKASAADWILRQRHVQVRQALVVWEDHLRGAPPLIVEQIDLEVDNLGPWHRFGLRGVPAAGMAGAVDLRGDLRGDSIARLTNWRGQVFAQAADVDLAIWQAWIDYPVNLPQGRGGVRAWLELERGWPVAATADVALADLQLRLRDDLPALDLQTANGRMQAWRDAKGYRFAVRGLAVQPRDGPPLAPLNGEVAWQMEEAPATGIRGTTRFERLDLAALGHLARSLPLDAASRQLVEDYAPQGQLRELAASWRGNAESLAEYALTTRFDDLGWRAQGRIPGAVGLSGSLETNQQDGLLVLRDGPAMLDLPAVFPESRLAFDTLAASVQWRRDPEGVEVVLRQASFSAPDAQGAASGRYRWRGYGAGEIDLSAKLERADARAVWRYMPHLVPEATREWLRNGLQGGVASDVELVLRGDLQRFPFAGEGPARDQFLVTGKLRDGALEYAPGWPPIADIQGELRFAGAGMEITARRATSLGAALTDVRAAIDDFAAPDGALLRVKGKAAGPSPEFVRFLDNSPLGDLLGHFYRDMRIAGNGELALGLEIPLNHAADTRVDGQYRFLGNAFQVTPLLPAVEQLTGTLMFTDSGATAPSLAGSFLDAPLRVSVRSENRQVFVSANGAGNPGRLRSTLDWPLLDEISGSARWRADVSVRPGARLEVAVTSDLQGLASRLPAPLGKSAASALPLRVVRSMPLDRPPGATDAADGLRIEAGSRLTVQLTGRFGDGAFSIARGGVAIDTPLRVPDQGWLVAADTRELDLDAWRAFLDRHRPAGGDSERSAGSSVPMPSLDLRADRLRAFGRDWQQLRLTAIPAGGELQGRIEARELGGDWQWQPEGRGRLRARLKHLHLPKTPAGDAIAEAPATDGPSATAGLPGQGRSPATEETLPDLDILADDAAYGDVRFGRLELAARNEGRLWQIQRLAFENPDGEGSGTGLWQTGTSQRTELEFDVKARNVGGLLDRFGYADAVRRGTASVSGRLAWVGPPTLPDIPSLSGELKLAAAKGQFNKLEPGIGKLVGLFSLQTLPRRITLDFRDVFSEGFAFDDIDGRFGVKQGVLHTDELRINGPAAKVLMSGDVDLKNETQNLRVAILPELGGTVALGAVVLANPVAGVATLLAQKLLRDPLNKAFAVEYQITGGWNEPKVDKVGQVVIPGRGPQGPGRGAPAARPAPVEP